MVLMIVFGVAVMNYALYETRLGSGRPTGTANLTIGKSGYISTKWIMRPVGDYFAGSIVAGILMGSLALFLWGDRKGYVEPEPPEEGWSLRKMFAIFGLCFILVFGVLYFTRADPSEWYLVRSGEFDVYRVSSDGQRPVFVINAHVHDFYGAEVIVDGHPNDYQGREVELWYLRSNNTVRLEVVE